MKTPEMPETAEGLETIVLLLEKAKENLESCPNPYFSDSPFNFARNLVRMYSKTRINYIADNFSENPGEIMKIIKDYDFRVLECRRYFEV